MGSVKQNSKTIRMTALVAAVLLSSISFDRASAQDSTDPVVNGDVTTLQPPPPTKRSLKLRSKQTPPAPEAAPDAASDETTPADVSAAQVAAPVPKAAKSDVKEAAQPQVAPLVNAPTVKSAPPSIAKAEAAPVTPAAPLINVPNLAAPSNQPSNPPLPPVRPQSLQTKSVDLSHGDATGAADDEERQMYKSGQLKASDAEKLPESGNDMYTVKADRPILMGSGKPEVVGNVKAGDKFEVVLPGERFARVRFSDGRVGFVDNSAIVPMEPVAPIQPAKVSKRTPPQPITVLPPQRPAQTSKLQAGCEECDRAKADNPQAIDHKKTRPLRDIARHLNRQNRLAGLADNSEEPVTSSHNVHGLRTPSADYIRRMHAAAEKEAVRPRLPSSWMRAKYGNRLVGGNRSKGACFSAVKDLLVDMHLAKAHDHTLDNAYDAHKRGYLKKLGLTNILPDMKAKMGGSLQSLARNAPTGAILVYDQGRAGHIEVKAENNLFCSDFCSNHPVNTRLARRLIAVYVP